MVPSDLRCSSDDVVYLDAHDALVRALTREGEGGSPAVAGLDPGVRLGELHGSGHRFLPVGFRAPHSHTCSAWCSYSVTVHRCCSWESRSNHAYKHLGNFGAVRLPVTTS